jgi:peptidoglycan/LPS O-acetylase OafA/YrhL
MQNKKSSSPTPVDSTIWINLILIMVVLGLHHVNYTKDYLWEIMHRFVNPYESGIDQIFQKFTVGGFLFLSGYKLAISKKNEPIKSFFVNRFTRIYPLYLLSIIVFSFSVYPHIFDELPTIQNFVLHCFALQSWLPNFFQNNYVTLWFVSNLLFCYLTFPILRQALPSKKKLIAVSVVILSLIYALENWLKTFNIDIFANNFDTYFLFFVIGMFISQTKSRQKNIKKIELFVFSSLAVTSIAALIFFKANAFLESGTLLAYVLERFLILSFTTSTYWILLKGLRGFVISGAQASLLKKINAASFCVFLFHRPIWTVLSLMWSDKSYLQSIFILGMGIPIIFLVSYQIQFLYGTKVMPYLFASTMRK